MSKKKFILTVTLIIILFVFPIFLRSFKITKDRPKTFEVDIANHDDGIFTHNARNKALFGKWILDNDDWNPIFQYPFFMYTWYVFFKLFGVGFFQGRLLSTIFGLLSLIFFYKAVKKGYTKNTAVIATLFLSYNFILMMYHTSMMVETFMIFFIVITLYFWEIATRKYGYLFLVGFFCFLAIIAKASSIWLLGTCVFSLFPLLLKNIKKKNFLPSKNKKIILYFGAGLMICALLYLFLFFMPNYSYIKLNLIDNQIQKIMGTREFDKPSVPFLYKVSTMPFNTQFFVRTSIISIMAFVYIIYFITSLPKDFKRSDYMDFFVLNWVFFMFVFFVLFHNPIRRSVAMIPALAILSARAIINIRKLFVNVKSKFKLFIKNASMLILIYIIVGNIIMYGFGSIIREFHPVVLRVISILGLNLPPFQSNALNAVLSAVFAFIFAVIVLIFIKITKLDIRLKNKIKRIKILKVAILFVALSLLLNLGQYGVWLSKYDASFYRASRELGRLLPENTKVYGSFSAGLSMENKIIPVYPECPLINCEDRFEREDIRYILITLKSYFGETKDEVVEWKQHYPNLKLIKIFYVNDAEGTEIGLFDKFPERDTPE